MNIIERKSYNPKCPILSRSSWKMQAYVCKQFFISSTEFTTKKTRNYFSGERINYEVNSWIKMKENSNFEDRVDQGINFERSNFLN